MSVSTFGERASLVRAWREDPRRYVRERFGAEPDGFQDEALGLFPHSPRLALKACKGPGKTAVLSWIAWNFLETRPYPKIAATSITGDNLQDNLWTEMAKWQQQSPYLLKAFQWTKTRIFAKRHPERWWMSARTWAKTADRSKQADTLSGLHEDFILFILDESGAIPKAVMITAEAAFSSAEECHIVQAGNPVMLEGPLYDACTSERHLWDVIEITGDPEDPRCFRRQNREWARGQIALYGRDNPWVTVNILGRFPPSSINSLLGPDEVHEAMRRCLRTDDYDWSQKRLGVDVARFGDDRTVLFPRQGLVAYRPVVLRNRRTTEIAARIAHGAGKWLPEMIFVDDSGHWGHGVIDNLLVAGLSPMAVLFEDKKTNDPRYFNLRTEMWMAMAEWVKRGGALPSIPELARELTAPTYTYHEGKIRLEAKDQIKERIGVSPDLGDALCLTFAIPDMPSQAAIKVPGTSIVIGGQQHLSDFDEVRDI